MRKLPKWDINIGIADNGVVVRVGCKTFVFEDVDKAMYEINSFVRDKETDFSKIHLMDGNPVCNENEAVEPPTPLSR